MTAQNGTCLPAKTEAKHRPGQQRRWLHRTAAMSAPATIGPTPPPSASPSLGFESRSETAASEDSSSQWYTSHNEPNGRTDHCNEQWVQSDLNKSIDKIADETSYANKRGSPSACIFVASLTKDKNDEELNISVTNHFSRWGELLNVKVLKDWMERPYAFVQYERVEDAKRALQEAPGTVLDGRSIRCEPARVNRTICLAAYEAPLHEDAIRAELSTFGNIEDITKLDTYFAPIGQCECMFVKFCFRDDAIKAFLTLRAPQNPQKWWVEWASNIETINTSQIARARPLDPLKIDRTSIFVGNLDEQVTETDLQEIFVQYGKIAHVHVVRKPGVGLDQKRVFAFIKYNSEKEASNAIENEKHKNGSKLLDRPMRVAFREQRKFTHYNKAGKHGRLSDRPHPPGLGYPASVSPFIVATTPVPGIATNSAARPAACLDKVRSTNVPDSTKESCKVTNACRKKRLHDDQDQEYQSQWHQEPAAGGGGGGGSHSGQDQVAQQSGANGGERPSNAAGQTYGPCWPHTQGLHCTRGTFNYGVHPAFNYGEYLGPPPLPGYYTQAPAYQSGPVDVETNVGTTVSNNHQADTREGRAGNDDAGYVYSPVGYYDFTSSPYFAPTVGYYSDPRTTQPMIPPSSFNRPCSYYQRRGSKPGIYAGGTTYYYAPPPPPAPVPFGTTQFAAPANPGYIYPPTMVYGANTNDPANAMQPVSPNSSSSASPASNDLSPPNWNADHPAENGDNSVRESKSV